MTQDNHPSGHVAETPTPGWSISSETWSDAFLADIVRPFQGRHNRLRGGWSDGQLQTMSRRSWPGGHPLALTIAIIICSLIAEKRTTGSAAAVLAQARELLVLRRLTTMSRT